MTPLAPMDTVEIDPAILAQFEALEDSSVGKHKGWTKEEDALLVQFWGKKKQTDVARLLGRTINPCRERYRHLTSGGS